MNGDKMLTPLVVSSSPHVRAEEGTGDIMRWVCVALAPAFGVGVFAFGLRALAVALVAVAACVLTEAVCCLMRGRPVAAVNDFSAVVSGLLLAAVLPPNIELWVPAVGGVFAMGIVKHAFGGLGNNIWNPALAARAMLQVSFPAQLNSPAWPLLDNRGQGVWERIGTWMGESFAFYGEQMKHYAEQLQQARQEALNIASFVGEALPGVAVPPPAEVASPAVISGATPLTALKALQTADAGGVHTLQEILGGRYWEMVRDTFTGIEGGCIAETSAIALLIGGLFLLAKKIISWETPVVYLATLALLTWALPAAYTAGGTSAYTPWFCGPALLHLGAGGAFLGAFFMETDYVTSPLTRKGKIIFAFGCGVITALIRLYSGSYPEGCCYSILLMNTCVPLIDSWTRPRKYGAL